MMPRPDKLRIAPLCCVVICLCTLIGVVPFCRSYPTSTVPLDAIARAPVLATVKVEQSIVGSPQVGKRTVLSRATLLVLRSFPRSAIRSGERIQLDFEQLTPGDSVMSGPSVPHIQTGSVLIVPLKVNPRPATDAWCLVYDEGIGITIPAITAEPAFEGHPTDGREFILQEIASALSRGTQSEVLAEAWYFSFQKTNGYASDLMKLLTQKIDGDVDRMVVIAAALVASLPIPRPTVENFVDGRYAKNLEEWRGSLVEVVLKGLSKTPQYKERLIHQLLTFPAQHAWGVGITLQEFAREEKLVRELRTLLKTRRTGSLFVAYDILKQGQDEIRSDAASAALGAIDAPGQEHVDIQAACWVLRDFGTDEQFRELVKVIKKYQYLDRARYDELWRDTIWSDNNRERAVLEILLADQRFHRSGQRYSDIAQGELTRLRASKPANDK